MPEVYLGPVLELVYLFIEVLPVVESSRPLYQIEFILIIDLNIREPVIVFHWVSLRFLLEVSVV